MNTTLEKLQKRATFLSITVEIHALDKSSFYSLLEQVFIDAYCEALLDYGIWKDGTQRIGCMETSVQEIIKELKK